MAALFGKPAEGERVQATHRPKTLGRTGEAAAERYLSKLGYSILDRNYRTRGGEIDLVVSDRDTLVFVEVKTRESERYGEAVQAVTPHKQEQMSKTALAYLQSRNLGERPCRFDVIALKVEGEKAKLTHYKNAFPLSEKFWL